MHINSLPVELFVQILDCVPLRDAMDIMLVNKAWYKEYKALLRRQSKARFKEILFSEFGQTLIFYQRLSDWDRCIANKLLNFCKVFDNIYIYMRFKEIRATLEKEMKEKDWERIEVDRLMAEFEASPEYDGWYPNWLWERNKKTYYNTDCKWKLETLERRWKLCKQINLEQIMSTLVQHRKFHHIP
jgi:hypothetical protein